MLAGDFVQSIRDFKAGDATAQENLNPTRIGREALIAHEQKTLDSTGKVSPHLTARSSTATASSSAGAST